ncbi:hypothetical protein ACHAPA_007658 [Fusarium lateritium]
MHSPFTLSLVAAIAASHVSASVYPVTVPPEFFSGPQSGIGSWYRANSGADSTSGTSWCGYKYSNSDPLFAVSLNAMGRATYGSNPTAWRQQTQKYCGLEALVTDPSTGKSKLMYIGDAFDDKYIKGSRASIDIMVDAFSAIHGNPNGDKNKVIKGVTWQFTGNVNTQYTAAGASWPTASVPAPKPTSSVPAPNPTSPSEPCAGCLGAKCDGQTSLCKAGLTCLSPDGICSDKACNWGCVGWSCSADIPCQKPQTCISGVCKA